MIRNIRDRWLTKGQWNTSSHLT